LNNYCLKSGMGKKSQGGRLKLKGEEKKNPIDFLKAVEGIKKTEEAEKKEAFKQIRGVYLDLLDAGFDMIEAMAFIAAMCKASENDKGEKK